MSWNIRFGMIAIVAALLADSALAQKQRAPRNPVGAMHLVQPIVGLESEMVRKELKLTDEQDEKIKSALEEARDARKKVGRHPGGDFRKLSKEEREARLSELRTTLEKLNNEMVVSLTDEQMARFKQLRIWIHGGPALFCEEIITELKLVTIQTDALAAIFEKYRQKMADLPQGDTEEQRQKKLGEIASLQNEEYLGVLTKEQREQFDKMRGPKFAVEISEFPTIVGDR